MGAKYKTYLDGIAQGWSDAWDRVRGSNADLCKSQVETYRLMVGVLRRGVELAETEALSQHRSDLAHRDVGPEHIEAARQWLESDLWSGSLSENADNAARVLRHLLTRVSQAETKIQDALTTLQGGSP